MRDLKKHGDFYEKVARKCGLTKTDGGMWIGTAKQFQDADHLQEQVDHMLEAEVDDLIFNKQNNE